MRSRGAVQGNVLEAPGWGPRRAGLSHVTGASRSRLAGWGRRSKGQVAMPCGQRLMKGATEIPLQDLEDLRETRKPTDSGP